MTLKLADKTEILQKFLKNILDNYRRRIDNVSMFMNEVLELLVNFHQEQEKMMEKLKELLSRARHLRKKDFEQMVNGLRQKQDQKEKELKYILISFLNEENKMVEHLRTTLLDKKSEIIDFQKIKQEILEKQAQREKEVGKALRTFHLEIEEITQGLRKLLEKEEKIKIRDLREFVNNIYLQQEEREVQWGKSWDEFWVIREEINCKWQEVALENKNGAVLLNI